MAERITISRLRNLVEILKQETGNKIDYELDGAYGGYRLVSRKGSSDVSPRLSVPSLYYWIHALLQGIQIGKGL